MEPFSIHVSDDVLNDVKERVARTRWPLDFANDDWQYGANTAYMKELADYWVHRYDWRAQERKMNAFAHFRTKIDGVPIHFIHQRGKGPNPMPLIMTHGWPWTFWDLQKVIGPLCDPASFGGDPNDAFDVVVPSLPGYGYSTPLTKPGVNCHNTADLWVKLMQDELGYKRFAAQGGDWGSILTTQLGHKYADRVIGVHIHLTVNLDVMAGNADGPTPEDYSPEEQPWLEKKLNFFQNESGYSALHMTKPQTPAVALADSPMGLAAWIVEKRRTWGDTHGNVESRFSKDDLITTVMLYWVTESIGTSMRYYYEMAHHPWVRSHDRKPVIEAPTAIAALPGEIFVQPRRWAERYYNLKRWTVFPEGGHFAAMEVPDAMISDIRAFFRTLRG